MTKELRLGDSGEAVRDLHRRLVSRGYSPFAGDVFDEITDDAVRSFQTERGLRVDGIIGRQTFSALVESGLALGDRMLYLHQPLLRGDDVLDLQHQMNALGFAAGPEDGIFGPLTHHALLDFQLAAGLPVDGICGDTSVAELSRVGARAAGSAAGLREREGLRQEHPGLLGRRLYIAASPEMTNLGDHIIRGLIQAGATGILDGIGAEDSATAQAANRFEADFALILRPGDYRCAYFASPRHESVMGRAVAEAIHGQLAELLVGDTGVHGKTLAVLRETSMPTVVCELIAPGDAAATQQLATQIGEISRAIVKALREVLESNS